MAVMSATSVLSSRLVAARSSEPAPLVSRDGDRTILWMHGEYDASSMIVLADELARLISADDSDLVVDLSGVTFIGSAPIAMLVRGRSILRRQSRTLTFRSPSRCARRVLELCKLADVVEPVAPPAAPVIPFPGMARSAGHGWEPRREPA
jgi:anti-sigma B factor antagonist